CSINRSTSLVADSRDARDHIPKDTRTLMYSKRLLLALAAAAAVALSSSGFAGAENFSAPQRTAIGRIIKEYLCSHPEVRQDAMAELEKRQQAAEAEKSKVAIKSNEQEIFSSARQVTIGNPEGDVALVEFFDYNCGYCKRALSDLLGIMKSDP